MYELTCIIYTRLPSQIIKKHPTDRPLITKKIKKWINNRQIAFIRHGKDSLDFKFWRDKVQCEIKMAKYYYYNNRVSKLENLSSTNLWKEIKRQSGQDIKNQERHHQFLEDRMILVLVWQTTLSHSYQAIHHLLPQSELLVTCNEANHALSSINTNKAVGPDIIPDRLLKDFAFELASVIQDIYNQSLEDGILPST